jgi:hypothetical protein
MVFGFPLSGSLTSGGNFTSGLVSGLRGFRDAAGAIQITAPVQPGNSGGPVIDGSGLVVGVVQAKLDALRTAIKTGDIPQNVNFAVSLDVLAEFLAKNKVPVRDAASSKPLDTASVAELAQGFTYRVVCRGKAQQAAAPNVKPPQQLQPPVHTYSPPECVGVVTLWNNCMGTLTWPDGQKYVGEFRDGWRNGQGTATWPSGQKYVGEFRDDNYNGQGTLTFSNGQKYVGEFRDGKPNGQGTLTWPDGQKYVGEFRDGRRNGQGTLTWPDGAKYVGEFRDRKANGQGTKTLPDGSLFHSGLWADDEPVR